MKSKKEAALAYVKRGWTVFPIPPGTKKSYKSAKHSNGAQWGKTRDPKQVERDFNRWPKANIGLPTGKDSGFWVTEADTSAGHGTDGIASMQALERKWGKLPNTLRVRSPSGSLHWYWTWPHYGTISNSASKVGPGIDVRGEGGMVVAPPSVRSDGEYVFLNNVPIREAPRWLIELAIGKAEEPIDNPFLDYASKYGHHEALDTGALLEELVYPGNVHDTENKLLASKLSQGEPADEAIAFVIDVLVSNIPEAASWDMNKEARKLQQSAISWFRKKPDTLDIQPEPWPVWLARKFKNGAHSAEKVTDAQGPRPKSNGPAEVVEPADLWEQSVTPDLPHGLLPKVIEAYARAQGELMGADPAGLAMAALVVCAAVIPDRIKVQPKEYEEGWKESARLWAALVGGVSAMKSPILRQAMRPVVQIDKELMKKYAEAKQAYDDMEKDEKAGAEKPKFTRLKIEDSSPEAVQPILRDSPEGVLLFRDELGGWFGAMDKYAGGGRGAMADRGFWLTAYNGGTYTVDRVTRGSFYIENLSVSVLGGIQPEPLRAIANEGMDDGLLQRLIPIMLRDGKKGKDAPRSREAERYHDLVLGMYERLNRSFFNDLKLDAEARVIRDELEDVHLGIAIRYKDINRKLVSHVGKYNGMFARLCLVWHGIEHYDDKFPTDINGQTAKRVATFMHEFMLPHAKAFYGINLTLSDSYDRLVAVANYILARELKEITSRDVQRGTWSMRALDKISIEKLFSELDGLGWTFPAPPKYAGGAVRRRVNLAVHERFASRAESERTRLKERQAELARHRQSIDNSSTKNN